MVSDETGGHKNICGYSQVRPGECLGYKLKVFPTELNHFMPFIVLYSDLYYDKGWSYIDLLVEIWPFIENYL
jgi:hypothetical protein